MESRRRPPKPLRTTSGEVLHRKQPSPVTDDDQIHRSPKASDALPLPLYLTNAVFFTLFFSVAYYLLHRWRDKIRNSTPLHVVTLSEIAAIVSLIASFIYLLGFFGIDFVQSFIARASHEAWDLDDATPNFLINDNGCQPPCPIVRTPNLDRQVLPTWASEEMRRLLNWLWRGRCRPTRYSPRLETVREPPRFDARRFRGRREGRSRVCLWKDLMTNLFWASAAKCLLGTFRFRWGLRVRCCSMGSSIQCSEIPAG